MTRYIRDTLCLGCFPAKRTWNKIRAEKKCPTLMTPDKSYGVQVCDGTSANQKKFDYSLANSLFRECDAWCVYDYETLMNNIETGSSDYGGFLWQNSASCWKWVTSGICFTDYIDEYDSS